MTTAIPEAQKANEASFKRSTATRVLGPDTTLHLCHPILHTVQPAPDAPACAGGGEALGARNRLIVLKKSPNSEEKKKNGSRTSGLPSDAWPARLLSKLHITPAKSHAQGRRGGRDAGRRAGLLGLRLSASGAPSPMALGGWGSLATADRLSYFPFLAGREATASIPLPLGRKVQSPETQAGVTCGRPCVSSQVMAVLLEEGGLRACDPEGFQHRR